MAEEEFNPYYKWLGIPPSEQPPNHYRLLGLELLENDPEVIESAADQRMAHLRTFQGGKNAQLSQQLLNEVSQARVCLLKPDTKAAYDETLSPPKATDSQPVDAPPVQLDQNNQPIKRSSVWVPVGIVSFLLIAGATTLFVIMQMNGDNKGDTDLAQSTSGSTNNGDNESDSAKKKSGADSEKNESKSTDKNDDGQKSNNADKTNEQDPDSVAQKGSKSPDKKSEQEDPDKKKDESASNDPGTGEKEKSDNEAMPEKGKMAPKKMDDGKDEAPKKSEVPLIIETKAEKKKEEVVRSGLPPTEHWKPFLATLKEDYDIKDGRTRDERFSLFFELISDAVEEARHDRAYAMFNLAMDEAKQLGHASGVIFYCEAFCKRFDFFQTRAETVYLDSVANSIESRPHVAKFLVEAQKQIRKNEREQQFDLAVTLLDSIVNLADKPIGKDINQPYFEKWLESDKMLVSCKQENEKWKADSSAQLTPEQHRMLGCFHCFVVNDWDTGLEHFAKCEFKPLVDIVKKSKDVDSASVHSMADLADAWWILSTKVEAEEHLFKSRAQYWYDKYQKLVPAADISKKIQKRIEELNLGIGLTRIPVARSPSNVLFINQNREVTPGATTAPSHIAMTPLNGLCIVAREDVLGDVSTRFRIVHTGNQSEVYNDLSDGFIDHPPLQVGTKIAWIGGRGSLLALDIPSVMGANTNGMPSEIRFRIPHQVRAFDIGPNGDVFALADKFIYWWDPKQAWQRKSGANVRPTQFDSPTPFIPSRIRVVPNSSTVALYNSRFLVRLNPVSKGITELHSGSELFDVDFAANGNSVVIAVEKGIRFKAFKGSKDLFFQTAKATKVRFLPNSRFIVSLHDDQSLRIWDTSEKNRNYLLDRLDLKDFKTVDFSISEDGSTIALTDDTTRILLLDLYYE